MQYTPLFVNAVTLIHALALVDSVNVILGNGCEFVFALGAVFIAPDCCSLHNKPDGKYACLCLLLVKLILDHTNVLS